MTDQQEANIFYPLFRLMRDEHDLDLTISEMEEIIKMSDKVKENWNNYDKDKY